LSICIAEIQVQSKRKLTKLQVYFCLNRCLVLLKKESKKNLNIFFEIGCSYQIVIIFAPMR